MVLNEHRATGQSPLRLRKIIGFLAILCSPFVFRDWEAQVTFAMGHVLGLHNREPLFRCWSTPTWSTFFFFIVASCLHSRWSISTVLCISWPSPLFIKGIFIVCRVRNQGPPQSRWVIPDPINGWNLWSFPIFKHKFHLFILRSLRMYRNLSIRVKHL